MVIDLIALPFVLLICAREPDRWGLPRYPLLSDKKALLTHIAHLVRRLHAAGYVHRDLYLSHIFLSKNNSQHGGLFRIDLQRVFKPRLVITRWHVKDLAQLYFSSKDYFRRTDTIRFLHTYFQCSALTAEHKRLARAILRKTQRIARHEINRTKKHTPST